MATARPGIRAVDLAETLKVSTRTVFRDLAELQRLGFPVTFALDSYLSEVNRIGRDYSWETPDRTAGRLILSQIDRPNLSRNGLQLSWVGNDWRAPELFEVCFMFESSYRIFLRFPWNGDAPQALAARALATINDREAPACWTASWHGMAHTDRYRPPRIAQAGWTKEAI